eukprot:CAMPEP_0184493370 /NCGR_PEP_ID=MMETSP0113_2-20130426/25809_1 /TAXON_ID=91329 /ORGANISM="Norrisiella sphaerica, Strain BC52" /LENGTH=1250 /DNA_ID=CAMNT_0026878603 /DNA_START=206 /DNA_END=3955 /DNA_ORIENTATION=-
MKQNFNFRPVLSIKIKCCHEPFALDGPMLDVIDKKYKIHADAREGLEDYLKAKESSRLALYQSYAEAGKENNETITESLILASNRYYAYLRELQTRLGVQTEDLKCSIFSSQKGVTFSWTDSFNPEIQHSSPDLEHEKNGVLFNIAALFSIAGRTNERKTLENVQQVTEDFQSAAGVLQFIIKRMAKKKQKVSDMNESLLKMLRIMMLAQAQESFFHACTKYTINSKSKANPTRLSRIAMGISTLFNGAHKESHSDAAESWLHRNSRNYPFRHHLKHKALCWEAEAYYQRAKKYRSLGRLAWETAFLERARINLQEASTLGKRMMKGPLFTTLKYKELEDLKERVNRMGDVIENRLRELGDLNMTEERIQQSQIQDITSDIVVKAADYIEPFPEDDTPLACLYDGVNSEVSGVLSVNPLHNFKISSESSAIGIVSRGRSLSSPLRSKADMFKNLVMGSRDPSSTFKFRESLGSQRECVDSVTTNFFKAVKDVQRAEAHSRGESLISASSLNSLNKRHECSSSESDCEEVPRNDDTKITAQDGKEAEVIPDEVLDSASLGDEKNLRELLKSKIDVNGTDRYGITALMHAARGGHASIVKMLLKEFKADIRAKDKLGRTAIIHSAYGGDYSTVRRLIKSKADVNIRTPGGDNPLILASEYNHVHVVKLFLRNASTNALIRDSDGKSAFFVANERGHDEVARILARIQPLEALQAYAREGNIKKIKFMLEDLGLDAGNAAVEIARSTSVWYRSQMVIVGPPSTSKSSLIASFRRLEKRWKPSSKICNFVGFSTVTDGVCDSGENWVDYESTVGASLAKWLKSQKHKPINCYESKRKEKEKNCLKSNVSIDIIREEDEGLKSNKDLSNGCDAACSNAGCGTAGTNLAGQISSSTIVSPPLEAPPSMEVNQLAGLISNPKSDEKIKVGNEGYTVAVPIMTVEDSNRDTEDQETVQTPLGSYVQKKDRNLIQRTLKDLDPMPLCRGINNPSIHFSIWEAMGESSFTAVHNTFFGRSSVYIIIFSMKEWITQNYDTRMYLRYWLSIVAMYSSRAPFALVGTDLDSFQRRMNGSFLMRKLKKTKDVSKEKIRELDSEVRKLIDEIDRGLQVGPLVKCKGFANQEKDLAFFPMKNSSSFRTTLNTEKIVDSFLERVVAYHTKCTSVPVIWSKVWDRLRILRADICEKKRSFGAPQQMPMVSVNTVKALSLECGVKRDSEIRVMLRNFHSLGLISYYENKSDGIGKEDLLGDHVILDPKW